MKAQTVLPPQSQLVLPLLSTLSEMGGKAPSLEVIDALADRLHIAPELRNAVSFPYSAPYENKPQHLWRHRVHWTRMTAVTAGLMESGGRGIWALSPDGQDALKNARPGICLVAFETPNGCAVWGEVEAAVGCVKDDSVQLLFQSPPYPINGTKKSYGNRTGADYINWMVQLGREFKRVLKPDGSMILNLGDVWQQGAPCREIYREKLTVAFIEELGLHLADYGYWHNPSGSPTSIWVTTRRVRLNNRMEHLYWFSKSLHPKANNRNVLVPYKPSTLATYERKTRLQRNVLAGPSGRNSGKVPSTAAGGAIADTLRVVANSISNDDYAKGCRMRGLPIHDARFPQSLPEFYIKFLTDPGDLVADFFFGSGTVGAAAEKLGRKWIGGERSLTFLDGARSRPEFNLLGV